MVRVDDDDIGAVVTMTRIVFLCVLFTLSLVLSNVIEFEFILYTTHPTQNINNHKI